MFAGFMQQVFLRTEEFGGQLADDAQGHGVCRGDIAAVIEHAVDGLYDRLRMAPDYARVLKEPVVTTLRHIDAVAEAVPGPFLCSSRAFAEDPNINAFFVNPQHMREVFSHSEEVRALFDANPRTEDCWGLMCMHLREQTQPGMALVNDEVRRDVMQTSISFSDHQVLSPGLDESSARCALKCCMFDGLLAHIRREAAAAKAGGQEIRTRLSALRARQRRTPQGGDHAGDVGEIGAEIAELEQRLVDQGPGLNTLAEHLEFVAGMLSRPAAFISAEHRPLCLSRQAVKLDCGSTEDGHELDLSEIRIASHRNRVAALVQFPRDELLPKPDMLRRAELFLIV